LLAGARIVVVDNGPDAAACETVAARVSEVRALPGAPPVDILTGHGNVGFGRGHNLAILRSTTDYHLVLNPDVRLAQDALSEGLRFLAGHAEVGLLAPSVTWPDGSPQYLCKRYPSVLDLALRGFAPAPVRRLFDARLARYEMRAETGSEVVYDVPIASGCFLLCERRLLASLGGFSDRFFLYFEDFDLSLRMGKAARTAYVPAVHIVHHGGGAARKGWPHVKMFAASGLTFFRLHGWRWW
jgi:GT2 family glycosyltransferase